MTKFKDKIREIETNEASRLRSLARVKFVGVGEKSKKTFFMLVKAKQQRKAMPILITGDDTNLKDEGEIIEKN